MSSKHTFNQFQREIQKRGISPENAYMFTLVYERLIQTEQVVDDAMKLLNHFAEMLNGFVQLREEDVKNIQGLQRKIAGRNDGVDVQSVAIDPSEKH